MIILRETTPIYSIIVFPQDHLKPLKIASFLCKVVLRFLGWLWKARAEEVEEWGCFWRHTIGFSLIHQNLTFLCLSLPPLTVFFFSFSVSTLVSHATHTISFSFIFSYVHTITFAQMSLALLIYERALWSVHCGIDVLHYEAQKNATNV